MDALQAALTDYVVTHNRLPCPASPSGLSSSASEAACAPGAKPPPGVIATTVGKNVMGGHPELEVWIGVVPTQELRLGGDLRRDGWGNDFTYAVSRRLTFPNGMAGNPAPTGIISVTDGKGHSVLDKPDTGRYVIISHGPAGDGGWTAEGVRTPCQAGTLAGANCKDNGVFVAAPYSRAVGPAFYDHFLVYDGPDAGGNLVTRIAACNQKEAFYAPTASGADEQGCVREVGVWHGACLQMTRFDKSGNPQPQPAVALSAARGGGGNQLRLPAELPVYADKFMGRHRRPCAFRLDGYRRIQPEIRQGRKNHRNCYLSDHAYGRDRALYLRAVIKLTFRPVLAKK